MANWCNNTVAFEGSNENLLAVMQMFQSLEQKETAEQQGQLPSFVQGDSGHMYCIYYEEEFNQVHFETKWSPNISIVRRIAEHFQLNYRHDYEELGCCVFGQAVYRDGTLKDTALEEADFDLYAMDEDECTCTFEGEQYESQYDVLEILLERRMQQ